LKKGKNKSNFYSKSEKIGKKMITIPKKNGKKELSSKFK